MTDRHRGSNRQRLDLSTVIPWENVSDETIPAYGVVQLRTDFDVTSKASKPDGASGLFFVNGPLEVLAEERGESLIWNRPRHVLIEGTVRVGDEVGPVEDQWSMSVKGCGYRVLRQPGVSGVGVVIQAETVKRIQVVLKEDLFAANDFRRDPSTADAYLLRRKANGDLARTTWVVEITNRFVNISVDAGTYAKAEWIDGEWQLYAADCPGGSESSSGSF